VRQTIRDQDFLTSLTRSACWNLDSVVELLDTVAIVSCD
jgi:hypothetical protein